MLRALTVAVLCLPLFAAGAAVAGHAHEGDTVSASTFVLRGRGWGHGVGMGQWGAYGQAKRGVTYARILRHYYPGTTLTTMPSEKVRVLLREGSGPYTISSEEPFRVLDGEGQEHALDAGSYRVGKAFALAVDEAGEPTTLPGPLTFRPGSGPLTVGTKPYRGSIVVQRVEKRLQVVNEVAIDPYVRGVVSEEVPDDWPLEAIKAQAVAARSYALAERRNRNILYPDTRSQVYSGVAGESEAGDEAVAATRGQVLTYAGKVATAFFFASSGGRTADVADVFAGGTPIPYLVSVPDPDDRFSPYHRWGPVMLPAARVSKALRVGGVSDLRTVPASGRAREVVVTGRAGEQRFPAADVRRALDLRSTWFTPGLLTLARPAEPLVSGQTESLTGVVRKVKGPVLLQQKALGAWQSLTEIEPAADGSFSVAVDPPASTWYRLAAADDVVSLPLRVPVAGS